MPLKTIAQAMPARLDASWFLNHEQSGLHISIFFSLRRFLALISAPVFTVGITRTNQFRRFKSFPTRGDPNP
jgi:hypothetical protein